MSALESDSQRDQWLWRVVRGQRAIPSCLQEANGEAIVTRASKRSHGKAATFQRSLRAGIWAVCPHGPPCARPQSECKSWVAFAFRDLGRVETPYALCLMPPPPRLLMKHCSLQARMFFLWASLCSEPMPACSAPLALGGGGVVRRVV